MEQVTISGEWFDQLREAERELAECREELAAAQQRLRDAEVLVGFDGDLAAAMAEARFRRYGDARSELCDAAGMPERWHQPGSIAELTEEALERARAEGALRMWKDCALALDSVQFPENASLGTIWALCSRAIRELEP